MRRSAALALVAAALLAGGGGAVLAGEADAPRPLSNAEKEQIDTQLQNCGAQQEIEKTREKVDEVVNVAAGRDAAVERIVNILKGAPNQLVRMAAAEALGCIGNPKALPALQEAVEFDPNYTVRRWAARCLAGFGDREAVIMLLREVPDFDGALRKRLAGKPHLKELGRTISRCLARFKSLIALMGENVDSDLQGNARKELQRLTGHVDRADPKAWKQWWEGVKDKNDAELLDARVNRTADRAFMMSLIELAALTDSREAIPGLIEALRRGGGAVQMAAAAALGRLGGAEAVENLRGALGSPDGWVRAAAAEALVVADPKNSGSYFLKLLDDGAPQDPSADKAALVRVRRAAVAGLRSAGVPNVSARLAALLVEPGANRLLCWEVADALRSSGTLAELPALVHFGASGSERDRDQALAAIGEICRREKVKASAAGGAQALDDLPAGELIELATGAAEAPAAAAVWELDRRSESRQEHEGLLKVLRSGKASAARILVAISLVRRLRAPASADLARAAADFRADEPAALAACAAVGALCSPKAMEDYLRAAGGSAGALSRAELEDRRRKAADLLVRLLDSPGVSPRLAAAAAGALGVTVPPEDAGLHDGALEGRVLEALVTAAGDERLSEARPAVCAALRLLTGQDFADDPKPWQRWWKASDRGKNLRRPEGERPGRGPS